MSPLTRLSWVRHHCPRSTRQGPLDNVLVEAWPGCRAGGCDRLVLGMSLLEPLAGRKEEPGVRVRGSRLTTPRPGCRHSGYSAALVLGKDIPPGDGPPVPSRLLHGGKAPGSHGPKVSSSWEEATVHASRAQVRSGQAGLQESCCPGRRPFSAFLRSLQLLQTKQATMAQPIWMALGNPSMLGPNQRQTSRAMQRGHSRQEPQLPNPPGLRRPGHGRGRNRGT